MAKEEERAIGKKKKKEDFTGLEDTEDAPMAREWVCGIWTHCCEAGGEKERGERLQGE